MGNSQIKDNSQIKGNSQIKETIDKHQELHKQIENNNLKKNLVVFNIPITFDYYRQSKSYINQITTVSSDELNNTIYNELYLSELGIIITNSGVKIIKNNMSTSEESYCILQTYDKSKNPIYMYKHFNWVDEPVPEIISIHIENIVKLQDQIKELEKQISTEKSKIVELNYVQSKLNKPIEKTNQYIKTVKYLMNEIFNL